MRSTLTKKFVWYSLLVTGLATATHCSSTPGVESGFGKKNKELIAKYNLTERTLPELPETTIESNLEPAEVKSLDKLDSIALHPGVNAKLFWGRGTMISILQLAPNAKIPEEVLSADRLVFVLEGSIDQSINGVPVSMISKNRENPDGTHSATPRIDFVYLEKGAKNAVTAGSSGAKLLEAYSPLRLDYLQKAGVKNLPVEVSDVETTQAPNIA
ncbi:MAG TPA: hypothetical protein VFZ47_03845, partial [Chitinophagaceae bacterium]